MHAFTYLKTCHVCRFASMGSHFYGDGILARLLSTYSPGHISKIIKNTQHFRTTFAQLSRNFRATFAQLSHSFRATFAQLSRNFRATFNAEFNNKSDREKRARAEKKNAEKKEFSPSLGKVGGARPRYGGRAGARARARAR